MMGEYVKRSDALHAVGDVHPLDYNAQGIVERIKTIPAADMVEVVRCRDCKHRIVNEHYGEKGYLKLKAMCELDRGDPFELGRYAEEDDWFCADGKRKDGGQDDA